MKIYTLAFLLLFLFPFAAKETLEFPVLSPITDCQQNPDGDSVKAMVSNIVFKSTDGGTTWQNISEGLPEDMQGNTFFADDNGLFLRAGNGLYHNKKNAEAPFWKKESFPDLHSSITPGNKGIIAYDYNGRIIQKVNGSSLWLPRYTNFQEKQVRMVHETAGGTVFIGSDSGLFRSTDNGKTWKQVQNGGWAMKIIESNGVLMATSQAGIIRSTDEGENWDVVISEGGVGIDVESIEGGFAAITYSTKSETRRVRTSYDGGKTWEAIDADLPAQLSIASIIQVGEYLFCGHPIGIFRSADKGKTWKLMLPAIENKVFNLFVSGKVIYALPRDGGC